MDEIGRRVDFRLAGKRLDQVRVERDVLEKKGRRQARPGRLGIQRLDAVFGRMQDRAAIKAARDHGRAHNLRGMSDVQLVGHEGAGRKAGNRHLRRIDR